MKSVWKILLLSFIHYILCIATLFYSFSVSTASFESPGPSTFLVDLLQVILIILWYPLALPLSELEFFKTANTGFPLSHLPLILNSLIWGTVLYFGWKFCKDRFKRNKKASAV